MKRLKSILAVFLILLLAVGMTACGSGSTEAEDTTSEVAEDVAKTVEPVEAVTTAANTTADGAIDATDLFSDRDLTQTADLSEAKTLTVSDGEIVKITDAGVYVISGSATDAQILVEAAEDAKVQLVLDGVSITNTSAPCIYVKSADKVFVTTTDSENSLSVTGTFTADGTTNTDAVIFSKSDLTLNGLGTLTIESTDNGITTKDDMKITGGTIDITCVSDALEANDSISVAEGSITISSQNNGLNASDDDDDTTGWVYLCGGSMDITASNNGVKAATIVQIDGGVLTIQANEGIEATCVQINGGTIDITAADDGINAGQKSSAYSPVIEINGGDITVNMGQGDTDAIDSNGAIVVSGGTISITAQSPFDYDTTGTYNGGTIIVNGETVNAITNQMMGGPGMMGDGMQPGGMPQGGMPQGGPGGHRG